MPDPIGPIGPGMGPDSIKAPGTSPAGRTDAASDGKSFKEILDDSINQVNQYLVEADKAKADFATGQTDNLDQVLLSVRKAELAFNTLMQIRNKLVDAFDEVMRMRI